MITVEQTFDLDYIGKMLLNPSIYESMKDDSSPSDPSLLLDKIPLLPGFFLKAIMDGEPVGAWWLRWTSPDTVEAHTALLPSCRGKSAIVATKKAIEWVFANTGASVISSYALSDSPAVSWFCRAVGMKQGLTEPWPNTRNGKRIEITHFTINRPIPCPPSQS